MKKLREDLNRDLKEIAAATRIKESFLRAIECEQYDKLPIEVYARGYIKVYAKYIGLDFESALQPYDKYLEMKTGPKEKKLDKAQDKVADDSLYTDEGDTQIMAEEPRLPKKDGAPLFAEVEDRPVNHAWYYSPRYIWKGILLVVILCVVIIIQLIASGGTQKTVANNAVLSHPEIKNTEPLKQEQQAVVAQKKPEVQTAQIVPPSTLKPIETVKPQTDSAQVRKRHVLVITATEKAWIQVTLDGKDKKEAMMSPGETLTYEATRSFAGIIGNGGGVKMKLNGKPLPSGKKGEVQYLNFPENKPSGQGPSQSGAVTKPDRLNQPPSSRQ